jgi:hypothetical protein
MYHTITFIADRWIDLERSSRYPLERLLVRSGTQVRAQLKPYIVESLYGPLEVADLFFDDGTATRSVPFACFAFVE